MRNWFFGLVFVFSSLAWADFINEPKAPYRPFTTKQKDNVITGIYDEKALFEITCDTNKPIYVISLTHDILQSCPMTQIKSIVFDDRRPHEIKFDIHLSSEAGVMRSKRASGGEAILGRVGDPLIKGIAGVYDIRRDFLLEWFGADWEWCGDRMTRDENGNLTASFKGTVTNACFNLVFRPNYYSVGLSYRNFKPWIRRPNLKSVNGWCSWRAYGNKITLENIKEVCAFIRDNFQPYGMDTVQIDNGYQGGSPNMDDRNALADGWMRPNGRFPEGPSSIAKAIASYGLVPGIWMSPGVTENYQREQRLRLPSGRPAFGNFWSGGILDMSNFTITNNFIPVFQAFKDAGFKHLKVDGLRHVLYEGLLLAFDADEATRRIRNFGLAARLTLGDDFYLDACWGIMPELADSFDACRVTGDCGDDFNGHHRQLYYFAEMFHLNRVMFVNDPDRMFMKVDPEWAKAKVSTVSLGGGIYMFGDKPDDLDRERIYILQRGLPSLETYPMESGPLHTDHPTYYPYKDIDESKEEDAMYRVGPRVEPDVDSPFSTLWAVHFAKEWGCWCVVTRNALWSLGESVVGLEKLGLDRNKTYLAYDFWEKKFLGELKDGLPMRALKYGSCQVVSLREKRNEPQLVASTRHVSMDAVSVKNSEWKDKELTLSLDCVENTTETYSFHVPVALDLDKVECEGGEAKASEVSSDGLLEVEVKALKKDVALRLKFVLN